MAAGLLAAQQAGRGEVAGTAPLRFALLFSGHLPAAPGLRALLADAGPLRVPSLHCHGAGDRQLSAAQHAELEAAFGAGGRERIAHAHGHLIPSQRGQVRRYAAFVRRACGGAGAGDETEHE